VGQGGEDRASALLLGGATVVLPATALTVDIGPTE
jgi:hypothetical protein